MWPSRKTSWLGGRGAQKRQGKPRDRPDGKKHLLSTGFRWIHSTPCYRAIQKADSHSEIDKTQVFTCLRTCAAAGFQVLEVTTEPKHGANQ